MSSPHFRRKRNLVSAIARAEGHDRLIPRNAWCRSSTQVSAPVNRTTAKVSSLVELLRWRTSVQPDQRVYTYLTDGETEGPHLTYEALDIQARAIGALLQSYQASGERALLLYPAGLEFISAFFGCLYAGVIAVPLPPPSLIQPHRTLARLRAVIANAQPSLVLTTSAILANTADLFAQAPELRKMRWLATDKVAHGLAQSWQDP